ncbi:phosphoribosyltransferase [Staphylococcus hyicus]|uniref:phosphoribosyltransferase n=1 Tax=Staphylococcus hyicus TaxID=1284 RepID=UPI00208F3DE7|nr:hypothetical protein [Staphylococcus hyicus]MCO4331148.1 hypothetical protein [Staphylococcus hyicus]MCO4333445.1 hypothetical protein [Staphylococcus hyicus]
MNILISSKIVFDDHYNIRKELYDLVGMVKQTNHTIFMITRQQNISKYSSYINSNNDLKDKVRFVERGKISKKFTNEQDYKSKDFVLIGGVDEDIWIASNNNILLLNPTWIETSSKVQKYGFDIDNPEQMIKCLKILEINSSVYSRNNISENTELISISSARNSGATPEQNFIINSYKDYLKKSIDQYKYAVFFHYLTLITQNSEFKEVDYWISAPSSSCDKKDGIYEIEDYSRYLMSKKRKSEIIIRHTPAQKSTEINSSLRRQLDSSRHFETLYLNPKFKNKLKGATVVVLDDYVTNGHTFEAVRNLLTEAGVKKIYLITMGTFKMPYQIQQVDFKDDISNQRYKFKIISKENITLKYDEKALTTINKIYEIITDK